MNRVHRLIALGALVALAAPASAQSLDSTDRQPTAVAASFDKTFATAIEQLASWQIPIRTVDRATGLLVTDPVRVNYSPAAQCAHDGLTWTRPTPTLGTFTVIVHGDSTSSSIAFSGSYVSRFGGRCTSSGVWESDLERRVKDRAERTSHSVASAVRSSP